MGLIPLTYGSMISWIMVSPTLAELGHIKVESWTTVLPVMWVWKLGIASIILNHVESTNFIIFPIVSLWNSAILRATMTRLRWIRRMSSAESSCGRKNEAASNHVGETWYTCRISVCLPPSVETRQRRTIRDPKTNCTCELAGKQNSAYPLTPSSRKQSTWLRYLRWASDNIIVWTIK